MRKFSKQILFFSFLAVAATVLAHEFWLKPAKFIYSKGETANIRFNVGENFTGENWGGNNSKINQFVHVMPNGSSIDLSTKLGDSKGDSLQLPLNEDGTHMVIFNSKNSFIKLEAKKFNNYLKEDGLQTAIDYRKQLGEDRLEGKEYYQRSVKTILQCGIRPDDGRYCTAKTSLPLDIVPEDNPYGTLLRGRELDHNRIYCIYFKQQPLPNILVRYWCQKADGKLVTKQQITNKKGKVSFEQETGETMISCVHMERLQNDTTANWQSYWSSVTFLYRQGNLFPRR